jgi:hypothetical protein
MKEVFNWSLVCFYVDVGLGCIMDVGEKSYIVFLREKRRKKRS